MHQGCAICNSKKCQSKPIASQLLFALVGRDFQKSNCRWFCNECPCANSSWLLTVAIPLCLALSQLELCLWTTSCRAHPMPGLAMLLSVNSIIACHPRNVLWLTWNHQESDKILAPGKYFRVNESGSANSPCCPVARGVACTECGWHSLISASATESYMKTEANLGFL